MAAQPEQSQAYRKSQRVNLGAFDKEEDVLDAIEQSRRVSKMMVAAVQKGSRFEVSQILEHYGLPMTSRLHFKVANVVMEQWFSLMGIEEEEALWDVLSKNKYAMAMLRDNAHKGWMRLSDIFSDWELAIGALQSKTIRRFLEHNKKEQAKATLKKAADADDNNEDKKDSEPSDQVANGGAAKEEAEADAGAGAEAEAAKDTEQKDDQ